MVDFVGDGNFAAVRIGGVFRNSLGRQSEASGMGQCSRVDDGGKINDGKDGAEAA